MGLADALRCTSVVYEKRGAILLRMCMNCLLYTSDAADD